jgi:hypothetical protein
MKIYKQIKSDLSNLGIVKAVAGEATVDGSPAILLRWNGKEEYVTALEVEDPYRSETDEKHCAWLAANFSDKNLDDSRE